MSEIWKDVVGYEGLYQVSNKGNVRSFHYGCKNLTPKKNNKGYLWVELRNGYTVKQVLVHRLVASCFIENPECLPQINHKDENPLNNSVENLEWCDQSYNIRYSLSRRKNDGVAYPSTKPIKHTFEIVQLTKGGELVKNWTCLQQIKHEIGKNEFGIHECCLGKRHTAYGYKWAFAHEYAPQENAVYKSRNRRERTL